jgi:anhydro-N-acetylmuramic acid kinase
MNNNIRKLHRIASAASRTIIGLMSGTSLDGLDIALCRITGSGTSTRLIVKKFATIPYNIEQKEKVLKVFAKPTVDFRLLSELNPWIALLHANMILSALKKWKVSVRSVDLIASHGQTVFHAPRSVTPGAQLNSTFQIGDGDHIAVRTGIITLSDFRQKHIAVGGEGAPLAVYGDYLLFSRKGQNRILLNIGGIGNFTFLPKSNNASHVFVTDTGPGNTLLDQTIREKTGQPFDKNSAVARKGKVNHRLLAELKSHPFFSLPVPKTTGPELFNTEYVARAQQASDTSDISFENLMATLTRFSAETICEAILKHASANEKFRVIVSGGGAHNPLLISWIQELLPNMTVENMEVLGISGDAKEAVLFAMLANEAVAGGNVSFGKRQGVPSVSMGKISFPL